VFSVAVSTIPNGAEGISIAIMILAVCGMILSICGLVCLWRYRDILGLLIRFFPIQAMIGIVILVLLITMNMNNDFPLIQGWIYASVMIILAINILSQTGFFVACGLMYKI